MDYFRRHRKRVDSLPTERRQRVTYRVCDSRWGRNCSAFAHPFDAAYRDRTWSLDVTELDRRNVRGGRDQIVHQRRRQNLSAFVVTKVLEHGEPNALSHTARDLSLDNHRVDHPSTVFDDQVSNNLHEARAGIYFHDGDVRCVGVWSRGLVVVLRLEARLLVVRHVGGVHRGLRDVAQRHVLARNSFNGDFAFFYFEIARTDFHQIGSDSHHLLANLCCSVDYRAATSHCAAAAPRTPSIGSHRGITLNHGNVFDLAA